MNFSKLVQLIAVLVIVSVLPGCGISLISYGSLGEGYGAWTEYKVHQSPASKEEDAIVQAALTKAPVPVGESTAFYLMTLAPYEYVALVGKAPDEEAGRYAEKPVTRYRVLGKRIVARMDTAMEVFPDLEFEKGILLTAAKAKTVDRVLLYRDGVNSVTMNGTPLGDCAASVAIYGSDQTGGDPLFKKYINVCP